MKTEILSIFKTLILATLLPLPLSATVFTNSSSITIVDDAPASTYPSTITTSGLSGSITNVSVTINNLTHSWVHDMSLLLVAPSGESLLLQSGTADNQSATNLTYTISDAGSTQFSSSSLWMNNGTYKPTAYFWDLWPAPAPAINQFNNPGPFGTGAVTLNGAFASSTPNGQWKLFIADFASGDAGLISGGWSLDISTAIVTPVTFKSFNVHEKANLIYANWEVENETNMSRYILEQSNNGSDFTEVSIVNAKNVDLNSSYSSECASTNETMYFRIKAIDKVGKVVYSDTKTVSKQSNPDFVIYPTIWKDNLTISSKDIIDEISVYTLFGQKLKTYYPSAQFFTLTKESLMVNDGVYLIMIKANEDYKVQKVFSSN